MGAQQTKSDDEYLNSTENLEENLQDYTKQNINEREDTRLQQDEHNFFNPLEDTVTPDQYHTLLPMNEIDSHILFSANSNKNTLTVAAFAKISPEPEQELNKSIDPYQCKIKRELLDEASNQELEPIEKETYSNLEFNHSCLETNNNVEKNSEQTEFSYDSEHLNENLNQKTINENQHTEIVSTVSNNIENDNNLLIDNSYLNEIRDLLQNREVKEELLELHGVPLENFEIQQKTFDIDEPYIKKESNLSTEPGNQDPLIVEEIPKQIKNEIPDAHVDKNLNNIDQEKDSSIILTEKNLKIQNNLPTENINENLIDDQSDAANVVETLNTCSLDTNKQSFTDNISQNTLSNKGNIKDPLDVEQQRKEVKTEIEEFQINTKVEAINKHLIQENDLDNHQFLKENSSDPLIIKDSSTEIKTELVAVDFDDQKGISKELTQKYDFVRNPFAYLKNLCKQKQIIQKSTEPTNKECNKEIKSSADVIIKSEILIDSDEEEIEITGQFTTSIKSENDISTTKEKPQTLCINDGFIIKSEPLKEVSPIDSNLNSTANNNWDNVNIKAEQIDESLENYQLPFIDINDNDDLNSSLDVNVDNLSTPDTNIDDLFFTQSNDDILSNSTAITSPTSSEYHSIVEISSLDDIEFLIPKSNIKKGENIPQLKRRGRPIGSKHTEIKFDKGIHGGPHTKLHLNSEGKTNSKKEKLKKKTKKCTKYTEKDSAFHIKSVFSKNIPKPTIVTRTKETTQISKSAKPKPKTKKSNKPPTLTDQEFPKPFKLEMTSNTENDIAIELPRPMVFKSESTSNINVNETQLYETPKFQPYVRLKRLKSEELLIPYKVRKIYDRKNECKEPNRFLRRSYPFVTKSTAQNMGLSQYSLPNLRQREFLIQNAYSLNPHVKLHRWSMDQDNPFVNNNHLTSSSFGMPSRNSNYRQSKYFTPQELHNLFQSPAREEENSSHSGYFDSGVSSSTPNTSDTTATTDKENKTLLLEIAAERAFINNHLLHFGFSPIHFELYNNVEDLNIFLKYLFGQLNYN